MKETTVKRKELKLLVLGAAAAITACTLAFGGLSQAAKAAELGKTAKVPTSYSAPIAQTAKTSLPSDYVKADYQVKLHELSGKGTAKDLNMSEAAELGAQNLWMLFHANLKGKTIVMSYHPATELDPRAVWYGEVAEAAGQSYTFEVDAITGDPRTALQGKYWKDAGSLGLDKKLLKQHDDFSKLVKETAENHKLLAGKIASVEYVSQGHSSSNYGSNPDITFMVNSEDGERAQLTFSRYNKELLSVEYNGWLKDMQPKADAAENNAIDKAMQFVETRSEWGDGKVKVKEYPSDQQ
ncbi:hypothetical protein [Cohnella herbarum]|uniref:Uncharacterized protein n=1 Tax=Cohnella herbarum TaxID=2728023 RepID=A0A7Z2ZNP6_9BACL|nr:hypothetical protein [Cohnella herbarum]QJD86299.1 hypothetical protein HH215_26105 [Cohnella herbarum]